MANHASAMPVDNNRGKGEMLSIGSFSCILMDSSVEVLICAVYSVFLFPWLCSLYYALLLPSTTVLVLLILKGPAEMPHSQEFSHIPS